MLVFNGITGSEGKVSGVYSGRDIAVDEPNNRIYVADVVLGDVAIIDGQNVPPAITSTSPPASRVGDRYLHKFTATGSLTPHFKVASGALPPGISLRENGDLQGIPTVAGTFTFSVSAINGYEPNASGPTHSVTIKPAQLIRDFNGDKRPDVISRDGYGNLWLYPGNGSGGWYAREHVGQGWNVMSSIVAPGDFNGDGKPDLLARDFSGALWLYPGNGSGGWLQRVQAGQGWNVMKEITAAGDLDHDGNADLVARDFSGYFSFYRGNGRGGWLSQSVIGGGWNIMTTTISPGDLNGDNHEDLLAVDTIGTLYGYDGSSRGYAGPHLAGNGWNAMTAILGPGDFNGDGKVDLLARDAGGALWLYPSNGWGGWLPRGLVGSGWNAMNLII
ncbi:hypothetical protein AR689_14785 [Arthrobacter sp. EpRS71]|nr:hypothetical protein AR689_14785 [Arthrobacter sp. EpRS71]